MDLAKGLPGCFSGDGRHPLQVSLASHARHRQPLSLNAGPDTNHAVELWLVNHLRKTWRWSTLVLLLGSASSALVPTLEVLVQRGLLAQTTVATQSSWSTEGFAALATITNASMGSPGRSGAAARPSARAWLAASRSGSSVAIDPAMSATRMSLAGSTGRRRRRARAVGDGIRCRSRPGDALRSTEKAAM